MLGYLGHMWELYAFWAWVRVMASTAYTLAGDMTPEAARQLGKLTAFAAIALGGLACIPAGWFAGRYGNARVAQLCLVASGGSGLVAALLFGGPPWAVGAALIIWGTAIIPDSALYSTLVADAAPPERVGSLLTLQTALGFLLTAATVQATPSLAAIFGWPIVLACLSLGPALGIWTMQRLIGLTGDRSA